MYLVFPQKMNCMFCRRYYSFVTFCALEAVKNDDALMWLTLSDDHWPGFSALWSVEIMFLNVLKSTLPMQTFFKYRAVKVMWLFEKMHYVHMAFRYLTSYFCLDCLSWSSNFSASSLWSQSHSSFAFSLKRTRGRLIVQACIGMKWKRCFYLYFTWVCPLSCDQHLALCVAHSESSSSFLAPLVFSRRAVSAVQEEGTWSHVHVSHMQNDWVLLKDKGKSPHIVSSETQVGQNHLLPRIVVCFLLGVFLFSSRSLFLMENIMESLG